MWHRLRTQGAELSLVEREGRLRRAVQGDERAARSDAEGLVPEVVYWELGKEAVVPAQLVEVEVER